MENKALSAIHAATTGMMTFCKFLAANDTGLTGGHQAGIYISKPSIPILFDTPGIKGENKEKWVKIHWHDEFTTDTRFIYYGQGTRNEYRITNFGKGFPYLKPDYTGALFVLVKLDAEEYKGFVLDREDEIDQFLGAFGISPAETNCLVNTGSVACEERERLEIHRFIETLEVDFPSSIEMSIAAQRIQDTVFAHPEHIRTNPDKKLLDWTDMEYKLFRAVEQARYGLMIANGFKAVEDFINVANQVLNRRKSRAGKSLEHHLSAIFKYNDIAFQEQAVTEGNKKPDFLFPSQTAYHDLSFPSNRLVTLAAKTTCKDRWRQVINEADRLRDKTKFLCTLQQGISVAQMDEMEAEKVVLVVPKAYIGTYPKERQSRIWTIARFIDYVREMEA